MLTNYLLTFDHTICTHVFYYINICAINFKNTIAIIFIIITITGILIIINTTIIITIIIIIRLKQCNTEINSIAIGMTSQFVDKHSNASSNSAVQPCLFSG